MAYSNQPPELIVQTPFFESYTIPAYDKRFRFKMNGIYTRNTLAGKVDALYDILDWNFTIIDTETNWKNLFWESLPFQFSWIKYRNWVEVDRYVPFINVWVIPDEILELTHTKQKYVDKWISVEDAIVWIIDFLSTEELIFAHNAWFDIAILNNLLVHTDYVNSDILQKDIQIADSMHYFYVLYKHILWVWVTGSSIEFLSNQFFILERDKERAHQADYDCELLMNILKEFAITVDNNREYIEAKVALEAKRLSKEKYILDEDNLRSDNVINALCEIWNSLAEDYEDYLEIKSRVDDYKQGVETYLLKRFWKEYVDTIVWNIFYVKKNARFETAQYQYLKSYTKSSYNVYSGDSKIEFFVEQNKSEIFSSIKISSEKLLLSYLKEISDLVSSMAELQIKMTNKMNLLKAHAKLTWFNRYGDIGILYEEGTQYLDRTPNVYAINRDYNKGLIKDKTDLLEYRDYNTNLTVQLCWEGKDFIKE